MTGAERRALLGDAVVESIRIRVARAPRPPAVLVDDLRRILTYPPTRSASERAA